MPLSAVPRALTRERMSDDGRISCTTPCAAISASRGPRIVVAGLNPHAGEGGTIGREDADIIAPAVAELARGGHGHHRPAVGR